MNIMSLLVIVVVSCAISRVQSLLFPVESESRQLIELGGLWDFKVSPNESTGFDAAWHSTSFKKLGHIWEMPVPSSFNDIVMDASIRDHVGWVWYQRSWFASRAWSRDHNRVFLRFGSVHYWAKVWLNGKFVGDHQGGHLPFEFEITDHLVTGSINLLTVAVNNRLHPNTLPQGRTTYPNSSLYPQGYSIYSHSCDYFDFSGINRPVYLYTTPRTYVKDVEFSANVVNQTLGALTYNIITSDVQNSCTVKLLNKYNKGVAYSTLCTGTLTVEDVRPWWPVGMNNNQDLAYLYTLQVQIGPDSNPDIFRQTVGFRTITWDNHGVQINGENLYIHGFGMHEDSNIKGRGFDSAVLMRDINLLQWVGANAIRTSHYPYAEETIAALERYGILVIVETPGCSIGSYDDDLLKEHKRILEKTIHAHRKRANVIIWSIANEPSNTTRPDAVNYFKELAQRVRELDPSRPSILVTGEFAHTNASTSAFQYVDIIGVNRYASWYRDSGKLSIIQIQVPLEMNLWYRTFDKPVLITEYGAGSLSGQHVGPAAMWSEDYQVQTLRQYFRAFDNILRSEETFFLGEMIWNFIDFKTPQEYLRPGLCVKGVFTRDRQPKAAAYDVRGRYCSLANIQCTDDYQLI
ncbi:hypothetical protein M8J77_026367 [Diaphorina citri]|nr:hypothetical protein M8J77_026367 [Diaphorina citri]